MPDRLRALAGRCAHLAVTVSNRGGTALTLGPTTVQIHGGTLEVAPLTRPHDAPDNRLRPGASRVIRIAVPLTDADGMPLPPRTYFCDVEQSFLDPELLPQKVPLTIVVRPAQPFRGSISIDFGTTVSAVAYVAETGAHEPQVLRLGEEDSFIPTAIA